MTIRVLTLAELVESGCLARREDGFYVRVGNPPAETQTVHVTPAFLRQCQERVASKKKPNEDDLAILRFAEDHVGEEAEGVWTQQERCDFMRGARCS